MRSFRTFSFLAALLAALLLPIVAHAQCLGGLISNCPAAVSPQNTDVLQVWQYGQIPHMRKIPLSQVIATNLAGVDLSAADATATGTSTGYSLAYWMAAILAEVTRAEAAEAVLTTSVAAAQSTANAALPLAGGTMTGALVLSAAPTASGQAATKGYVDATSPTVGSVRNLVMSVTSASASATLTADQIAVAPSLSGGSVLLSSFSHTINLATTGAGGMDTGSAPTSGYVAIYAIWNGTSAALLGMNATSGVAPSIYGGSHMPSGYTYSALISVWPTNSSGQFIVGYQNDRHIAFATVSVLSTTAAASAASLSISGAVPPNARSVDLVSNITVAGSTSAASFVASSSSGIGPQYNQNVMTAGQSVQNAHTDIITSQHVYYTVNVSPTVTFTYVLYVIGYSI